MNEGSLRHRVMEAIDLIEAALQTEAPDGPPATPSPWRSFFSGRDDDQGLYVLACPPGAGRQDLAASMVAEFLKTPGKAPPLAWFSLCEPAIQATIRLISLSAGFSPEAVAKGQARSRENLHRLTTTIARLAEQPALIDDLSGVSVADVWERCREWQETHGACRPILIDGVESLLDRYGGAWDSDPEARELIADDLRRLAIRFEAPVIALATLEEETPIEVFAIPWREHADLIAILEADEIDPKTGGVAVTFRFLKPRGDFNGLVTPLIFRTILMGVGDEECDGAAG